MTALTAKANISGTPSRATANAGFGDLHDFINERLGAGGASDAERAASLAALGIAVPRGFIDGLALSTAGSSTTMTVAAGLAADSTAVRLIKLSSALAKTTSAWSAGNAVGGKLSAAALANSTWYYWWLIRNPTTGVVDVGFDVSSSAPTLPSGYTEYRYIGAGLINGSGLWTKFYQVGDEFLWDAPVGADISTTTLGTAQTSYTVSIPRGRSMTWIGAVQWGLAGNCTLILGNPTQALPAPSIANGDLYQSNTGALSSTMVRLLTNAAAQISARSDAASTTLRARTHGWVDRRGRDE